jgi:hypothetical protein
MAKRTGSALVWVASVFGFGTLMAPQAAGQAQLPDLSTKVRTPCEVHPETAAPTADLWASARATLTSSTAADSNPPLLLIQKWRRTLTPSLRLLWERRDTSRIVTRQPFGVKPPSNLERVGYIQRMFQTVIFYGPDPDEILTERFLRQHCFGRVEGSGANEGLAGLTFDPLPTQEKPDVTGILWVDPRRSALRYVEYTWTNTPGWLGTGGAMGRTDFVELAGGGWVTQRWHMRIPKFASGSISEFDGYTEEGGELLAVGLPPRRKPRP